MDLISHSTNDVITKFDFLSRGITLYERRLIVDWINGHKSANTIDTYSNVYRKFFSSAAYLPLTAITDNHIRNFLNTYESQASRNLATVALAQLFKYLVFKKCILESPVTYEFKSIQVLPSIEDKVIPRESIVRMIVLEPRKRNQLLLKTLYVLGLRESELIDLTPAQFIEGNDGAKVKVVGKGRRTRFIHVPIALYEEIKSYVIERSIAPSAPLFGKSNGGALTRMQVWNIVKSAGIRAKVVPIPYPHKFRHSNADHALDAGATIKEIQESLGHASPVTTMNIYLLRRAKRSTGDSLCVESLPLVGSHSDN